MTEPFRISVKQLEMFVNCPRKWAGHYLFEKPQFQGESAAFGDEVHKRCALLGRGEPLPDPESKASKLARSMVDFVELKDDTLVEVNFKVPLVNPLTGRQFLVELRGDVVTHSMRTFYDYKTTGAENEDSKLQDGRRWTLDALQLLTDIQANVYAGVLFELDHEPSWQARWIYGSKKFGPGNQPKCWPVDTTFNPQDVRQFWQDYIWPAAEQMRSLREAFDEKLIDNFVQVPHDWGSCERSGKFCDIAGLCRNQRSEVQLVELGIKHPNRRR